MAKYLRCGLLVVSLAAVSMVNCATRAGQAMKNRGNWGSKDTPGGKWRGNVGGWEQVGDSDKNMTDEQRLVTKLFGNYNRLARPVYNLSDAVNVTMSLTITQIFELDEKNQVLIMNAWANLEWIDQYMKWDPVDYSGMKMVRLWSYHLWRPDIVLYNDASETTDRHALETRAMVRSDGLIFWSVPTKFWSTCKIDVTYFPFDEQTCHMKFGSWTHDGFKVNLVNSSTSADLALYIKSGEWDLLRAEERRNVVLYTCCIEPYPDVTFYLYIKRKPLFYTVNVFLPCLILSALTLLVFMLPAESGEKIGLGITIMLSFAVFMFTIIGILPDTSDSFPLIGIYLVVVLSMTAASIIIAVSLLNLSHRTSRSTPMRTWMKRMLDSVSPLCCVTVNPPDLTNATSNDSIGSYNGSAYSSDGSNDSARRSFTSDDLFIRHQLRKMRTRHGNHSASVSSDSLATQKPLTPAELLRLLTNELTETAIESCNAGNNLSSSYREVALGLHRLLEREQEEGQVEEAANAWRRLAQFIDRLLFWFLLCAVSFFTVFLLVISPSRKLL